MCGDRSTKTGLKLWDKIKYLNISVFTSDYWKSYEEFVPIEKLLIEILKIFGIVSLV